ncbi:hypothetical protein EON63_13620 [archaeon]|nr:MAG: hypothetical protein EON63_13620 [archaeon]
MHIYTHIRFVHTCIHTYIHITIHRTHWYVHLVTLTDLTLPPSPLCMSYREAGWEGRGARCLLEMLW